MAHTNTGIISAPVSFADVNAVLGTRHTDLAALCTDNNINMWAARKPIFNTKVTVLTDADWKGNGRTLSGYKTGGGIKKWADVYAQYISNINESTGSVVSQVWAYDKPASGSAYRLSDFAGYYHNVGRAFSINTLFGNISYLLIPSSDAERGRTVSFSMSFLSTTPDGGIAAAQLFGDCWGYYPAVIFNNGSSGNNSFVYAKTAPNPISAYAGGSVTINVDTGDFAKAIASDLRVLHPSISDPYSVYPLRNKDKWTACMVLLSQSMSSEIHKVPTSATIVRLEYASGCDRKTLPIKQSKYMTIEWMKMKITITRVSVSGNTSVYTISYFSVTAKMLSADSISFQIRAQLSTPSGTVNVQNTASGQSVDIDNYSNVTFSGTVGEVTKQPGINQTTYTNTASTVGNKLVNGTLTFKNSKGNFSGVFSFDISGGAYSYSKEVTLL